MKRISTGTENFKEFIDQNYYCVDKSQFIEVALRDKVSLFARPRRFGKTLNMSMLYYFLSNKEKDNTYLFDGLKISENKEIMKLQNQFPVISLSLKEINRSSLEASISSYRILISNLYKKFSELKDSSSLDSFDKNIYNSIREMTSSESVLQSALLYLSNFLEAHYHQKVVILIDEYDVPLQAAYNNNYYDEIIDFFKSALSSALKTNDSLYKGVLTGCLRIAKESIFTGLNNFSVYSILDDQSADCFGFTQEEIDEVLNYYSLSSHKDKIKEWYDGYLFGNLEIYNPWSTLYYIKELLINPNIEATSYWANTSSNEIVYNYIRNSDRSMKDEFEELVQGKAIIKDIKPELTYREMDDINNIYSFLLFTGYLKVSKYLGNNKYELVIPNKEVYKIYDNHFMDYFSEAIRDRSKEFVECLKKEDIEKANEILNEILFESVSFYDNYENFYHGFLVGLLSGNKVESNREVGEGRFDIVIKPFNIFQKCIVIECKKTDNPMDIEKDAAKAIDQIINKKYIEGLKQAGYRDVIGYGIAFYQKACYIMKA